MSLRRRPLNSLVSSDLKRWFARFQFQHSWARRKAIEASTGGGDPAFGWNHPDAQLAFDEVKPHTRFFIEILSEGIIDTLVSLTREQLEALIAWGSDAAELDPALVELLAEMQHSNWVAARETVALLPAEWHQPPREQHRPYAELDPESQAGCRLQVKTWGMMLKDMPERERQTLFDAAAG